MAPWISTAAKAKNAARSAAYHAGRDGPDLPPTPPHAGVGTGASIGGSPRGGLPAARCSSVRPNAGAGSGSSSAPAPLLEVMAVSPTSYLQPHSNAMIQVHAPGQRQSAQRLPSRALLRLT